MRTRLRRFVLTWALCVLSVAAAARPAQAQESVSDILSFLLTNRSINTDDAATDDRAAAATRDTIARFLLAELTTLPVGSSGTGFSYRLDRALGGAPTRSSNSFGPFYVERSLTLGEAQASLGFSYQDASFDEIDGRNLRDGSLVATAGRLSGQEQPFDVETLALRIRTRTMTASGNVGVTDRLDVGAAVPLVHISLSGERLDTFRGAPLLQATANVEASGLGDVVVRAKYNVLRRATGGLAVGGEARLPTGDRDNLLGSGELTLRPRLVASIEREIVALNGDIGYSLGGLSRELNFGGAVTVAASPRLTLVGEVLGRRVESAGRLVETSGPHPRLFGVETIRLTAVTTATERLFAIAGAKWNISNTWLLSGTVLRPLTSAGLNANWIPSLSLEYAFGG